MSDPTRCSDFLSLESNRAFAYGDGVFETIAVRDGTPEHLERHFSRLTEGCGRLFIKPPPAQVLTEHFERALAGQRDAVVKLFAVRESGGRGYTPAPEAAAAVFGARYPLPAQDVEAERAGIDVSLLTFRLSRNEVLAGVKHLNRLEQVLASRELDGRREGLVLDREGRVVEGTRSNLFATFGSRVVTPDLSGCGVAGVVRSLVIEFLEASGYEVAVRNLFPCELKNADELFLTNSVIRAWPVRALVGVVARRFEPGSVTREVQRHLGIRGI